MPSTNQSLDGFSEMDPVVTLAPVFEGTDVPVSYQIVDGDFGIHNDDYTIDESGNIYVLVTPSTPQQNFVRYRISVTSDPCQYIEDFILINWTEIDFTPFVDKLTDVGQEYLSINSADRIVGRINNMELLPVNRSILLGASWQNTDPLFTSSLFEINPTDGKIRVSDYYSIREETVYRFTVKVIDEDTNSSYFNDICLGPFKFQEEVPVQFNLDTGVCFPIDGSTSTTTPRPLDCLTLQQFYPNQLSNVELEFYEASCLGGPQEPPTYAVLYELCTTDFLEARGYTLFMSGLDSGILSPQVINFEEGETLKEINLVGDIRKVVALRSASSILITIIAENNEFVTTPNLEQRNASLVDPLLDTFFTTFTGYTQPLRYAVRSNQSYAFSDVHGLYVKQNNACYGRLGVVLGANPDTFLVPNGGSFDTCEECLGE